MFRPAGLCLALCLLFSGPGCALRRQTGDVVPRGAVDFAPSRVVVQPPPAESAPSTNAPATNAPSTNLVVVPVPEELPVARATDTVAIPPPSAPTVPVRQTNDIGAWLQQHGWSTPHAVSRGKDLLYQTEGAAGRFAVTVGQKEAEWNGRRLLLGFEPRVVAGRLWMHPLDIACHVEPLLGGGPLLPVQRTIVVDPGHGGRLPGSRSIVGNQFEKEFTLDWALRLRALLEARGWKVVMTRSSDMDLSLAERVDIAEAAGAALFVSLHFNSSFPSQAASGLETYCLTPCGMASHVVRDYPDEVARVFPNNALDADNLRLAVAVHRSVLAATGSSDRGVRHARFMDVLRWQNRPAILVEGGFLSNPDEARRIQTPEFRQRLAEGVAAALP